MIDGARLAVSLGCALSGAANAATVQHSEPLLGLTVEVRSGADVGVDGRARATQQAAAAKPTKGEPAVMRFNAFSREFALELEPNSRLARLEQRSGTAAAYRGKVAGRAGSWVRVVWTPQGPSGLVFDGRTLFGIDTVGDAPAADGAPAMFRLADVYFAPGELGCEIGAATIDGEQAVAAMAHEFSALAESAATRKLELGAVADFELSQAFGANAEAALLTRVNNVDGIFDEQLGIAISLEQIDVFTASDDPFTTSVANTLLDELARYRARTPSQDALGLTHLFTGRDLDGSTAGVAFFGGVCARRSSGESRSFGAGLSEARRGAVIDSLVAAHEIGHNFGAPHDGAAACAATPATFLMAPNINGSDQFSACSIREMQAEITTASCLTRIGPPALRVTMQQPTQVFAGVAFSQTANVTNDGADEAPGVVLTATAAAGLAIEAADAGAASCTVSPGSASCTLGAVGGGSVRDVTLTLRAQAPGTFDLAATATAAGAPAAGNASAFVTVTALPGIDLVWSGAASAVQLNAQTTITASLANAADFAATSVAVTATLAQGLRPDRATLGGSACTISSQTVSCPSRALAARGSVPLEVTLTGTAAGAQLLTVNAAATEADRAPADNQLAIAITVGAPLQSSGGGGAWSWLAVAALSAAYAFRAAAALRRRTLH